MKKIIILSLLAVSLAAVPRCFTLKAASVISTTPSGVDIPVAEAITTISLIKETSSVSGQENSSGTTMMTLPASIVKTEPIEEVVNQISSPPTHLSPTPILALTNTTPNRRVKELIGISVIVLLFVIVLSQSLFSRLKKAVPD